MTFPAPRARGVPRLLWQPSPETYHVALPLYGGLRVAQAGRETALEADSLHLHDTSQPYETRPAGARAGGGARRPCAQGAAAAADGAGGRPHRPVRPGARGDRRAARGLPDPAGRGERPAPAADAHRLGAVLVTLVTAVFGHELDEAEDAADSTTRSRI
ncbi:hypothetical protein NKH77_40200 [Streptomyces sp. M19]